MPRKLLCNAVFEGGGMKGIGLAGAADELCSRGYAFNNVAGTSAGAIVASLLAAGFTSAEIKDELLGIDYTKFRQATFLSKMGAFGKAMRIMLKYGVFRTDYFELWLTGLLKKKGVSCFGDLKNNGKRGNTKTQYSFQAIASDLSSHKMLILPGDLSGFGIDPDRYSVAKAVCMSISIPFFYEPFRLPDNHGSTHFISDGGLLSNYPIWLLDDENPDAAIPTFGFKFTNGQRGKSQQKRTEITNIIEFSKSMADTALDAHDDFYVSNTSGDRQRTILISTFIEVEGKRFSVPTTYFDLTRDMSAALYQNGVAAADKFLKTWDFDDWKRYFKGSDSVAK